MGVTKRSEYELAADELAQWIDDQGADIYWTVDGDPVLTGRISFPSPGDELAEDIRKIGKSLRVSDPYADTEAKEGVVTSLELDRMVEKEELATRVLELRWEDSQILWLLVEDEETTKSVHRETSAG
ncbi:MAG: hypothetical protein HQ581_21690 [Planctomycetes bacterium]|nr:hypothetical protein [Planctomycetota bacterium]